VATTNRVEVVSPNSLITYQIASLSFREVRRLEKNLILKLIKASKKWGPTLPPYLLVTTSGWFLTHPRLRIKKSLEAQKGISWPVLFDM